MFATFAGTSRVRRNQMAPLIISPAASIVVGSFMVFHAESSSEADIQFLASAGSPGSGR